MKKLVVRIMFNKRGLDHNELNKQWIKYRLNIFKNYTVKSLLNQTYKDFTVNISVRNETLEYIQRKLKDIPIDLIYNGGKLKMKELLKGYEYLYLIRLDSDDCFKNDYFQILNDYISKPETEVLITQNQYDYCVDTKRLASYWYKSPPSYTLIYKVEEYLKGKRHYLKNGHGGAWQLNHEIIDGFNFLSTLHGKNKRRYFNLDWKEKGYNNQRKLVKGRKKSQLTEITEGKENILKEFGIE